ncbi:MAG: hypothetical protein HC841_00080 [Verrucomicrobiae bacterium]|nr:hypothetical protein [Verrucomicrobiae bacterium]
MIPKEVDLWLGDYLVTTADMLNAMCGACAQYVDWKHDIDQNLHGACCGVAWNASPANRKITMYRVHGGKVDLSNVILMPV